MAPPNYATSTDDVSSGPEASHAENTESLTPAHAAAIEAWDAGGNPYLVMEDGSKQPRHNNWKIFGSARLTRAQVDEGFVGQSTLGLFTGPVFRKGRHKQTTELGLICFDFDNRPTFDAFVEKAKGDPKLNELVERILNGYMEGTPKDGVHTFYKCEEFEGNRKLAERIGKDGESEALIETRGRGGWVVTAPSNGKVHRSGRSYVRKRGGFATIATITPEERALLWDLARSFDEKPRKTKSTTQRQAPRPKPDQPSPDEEFSGEVKRYASVAADYNNRAGWDDVLSVIDWTVHSRSGRRTNWRRAGAKTANSDATTNNDGTDRLYVFSTSTPLPTEQYLTKFAAYAYLYHEGDFGAAAKELRALGYGTPISGTEIRSKRDRPFEILTEAEYLARPSPGYLIAPIVQEGSLFSFYGPHGSLKTFAALDMGRCLAAGIPWQGFTVKQAPVLYIMAEGASSGQRRIRAWNKKYGMSEVPDFFILPESVQLLIDSELTELCTAIDKLPQPPQLIFFDTQARMFVGGNENSSEDMGRLVDSAATLQSTYGAAVGLLHHATWQGKIRGSSALPGAVDTIIEAVKTPTGVELRCEKQKDDEEFAPIRLRKVVIDLSDGPISGDDPLDMEQRTSLVLELETDATTERPSSSTDDKLRRMLVALRDAMSEWLTQTDWKHLSNLPAGSVSRLADVAVRAGYADIDDRGKGRPKYYRITEYGRTWLERFEQPPTDTAQEP